MSKMHYAALTTPNMPDQRWRDNVVPLASGIENVPANSNCDIARNKTDCG